MLDLDGTAPDADTTFEASRASLLRQFPDLTAILDAVGIPKSRVTGSRTGGDLNLDLGHTTLYAGSAENFATVQVDTFRARPNRFYMEPPPRQVPPAQEQYHVTEALYAHAADLERAGVPIVATPADRTHGDGGYAIIYGIGLGLHLPALFELAHARHFVLVEEHAEFLLHALRLNDWATMLAGLERRGQTLHFVIGNDPAMVAARIHWYMRGRGFGLLDGSYLFRHYSSTLLDAAYADFVKNLPLLPVSIGYIEDELMMLDYASTNLLRSSFHLLDARPRLEKELPAIIVGSGPSLDGTIDELRRLASHAIVFSAGTSLLPLLRAGIRPDFHCELENSFSSVQHLDRVAVQFGLHGITLLASATVHPAMPEKFQSRIFFFRDSVCSTPLWCPDEKGIHGTAPTCTNLALRAALLMAFRDIYLFGVDLGTRQPSEYHSTASIYRDEARWKAHEADPSKIMNIAMPGNFGGTAWTNQILHWARMMMGHTIEMFSKTTIYNCSDGVAIPGTVPRLARTIDTTIPESARMVVLDRLRREMKEIRSKELSPAARLDELREALDRYYASMRAEVAHARDNGTNFPAFYDRMQVFVERSGSEPLQPVLRAINVGTLMMCFQVAFYFWRRVPEKLQADIMRVFLNALDKRLKSVAFRTDALLVHLHVQNVALQNNT